ncbi:MAG: nitroreductase family protein [Dehalococcoidia bacterium]
MQPEAEPVATTIASRRSIRRFDSRPVPAHAVRDLIALACTAPAPHASRPWRFAHITSPQAKDNLADAAANAWLADLDRAGQTVHTIHKLLSRSRRQLMEAPVLLLACLALDEARPWPDQSRRRAERDMFVQSLGAALQNILLAAHARGLVGYLKGAPLFCANAIREALGLPADWEPASFVLLGYPKGGIEPLPLPRPRPPLDLDDFLTTR